MQAFFNTSSVGSSYAWQFHYTTPSNGSWDENGDPGIGNIQ
jgi:hypothetical protein